MKYIHAIYSLCTIVVYVVLISHSVTGICSNLFVFGRWICNTVHLSHSTSVTVHRQGNKRVSQFEEIVCHIDLTIFFYRTSVIL